MKSHLAVLILSMVIVFPSFGEDSRDLYKKGWKAYESRDYVTAFQYLSEYRALNEGSFQYFPRFKTDLDNAIEDCRTQIASGHLRAHIVAAGGGLETTDTNIKAHGHDAADAPDDSGTKHSGRKHSGTKPSHLEHLVVPPQ